MPNPNAKEIQKRTRLTYIHYNQIYHNPIFILLTWKMYHT